ncbi:DNA repair protein RecO [Chitinibacter sp. ZOR0017]|uniref:DNA repair protein RecO n=1 Tax=Chitinibacter sp. ZOR0017 TaxID=1339254 RepID=UPI0006467EA9|nr:DNA repair protein RecO [Chitinibacter sp. ZOR0017]
MARSTPKQKINAQPAFVLHQHPYRETSRLLDVFTRDYGRLTIYARGVQRPGSQVRSVLLGFQPLLLSWFGTGEVKTLHAADWQPGLPQLSGLPLLCGFYLNELLQQLLVRDEPHPALFVAYFDAIKALARLQQQSAPDVEPILRRFERHLLQELGLSPAWHVQADSGEALAADGYYHFVPQQGFVASTATEGCPSHLIHAFARDDWQDEALKPWAKLWMRQSLAHVLGERPLHTRQLLIDLQRI